MKGQNMISKAFDALPKQQMPDFSEQQKASNLI
jgi:hypothetical protein